MQPHRSEYRLLDGAWVHARARLPEDPADIVIEPGALIGADVELGRGTWVGCGAVIYGPTRMGEGNQIHANAVLGGPPQDVKYRGEPTRIEIGDRNIFREGVTVHRASAKASGVTRIGSDNYFMANSHVGHDAIVEDHVILVNGVLLGGHCHVQSFANIGGATALVQFVTVGRFAFVGGTSGVQKDLEPFLSHERRLRSYREITPACVNVVGLKRAGMPAEVIEKIKVAYKVLFLGDRHGDDLTAARRAIEERGGLCPETEELIGFIQRKRDSRFGRSRSH